ncbi:hypothetical protein SLS55_004514 [Diplodia seriata]|uniref:JmjC domain-containing protein n=1 Tax=Diplodia seriata TaxID=420778 RepID=A0ABR3CJK4_9PEZI
MNKQVSQTLKWKCVSPIMGVRYNRSLTDAIANQPRLLPWSSFQNVVALFHWFKPADKKAKHHTLNTSSLRNFSQATVPLEYTGPDPTNPAAKVFRRFHAPLSVFLDYIENPPQDVHIYLAQCSLNDLPRTMRKDLPIPKFLKAHARRPKDEGKPAAWDVYDSSLWIGLPPTCTPLHRDPNANCFFQMAGTKTVRLLPPEKGLELFQRVKKRIGEGEGDLSGKIRGEEMMMGKEKEELEREVWDAAYDPESGGLEARLSRGEGLFIPEGWWHSVRGDGSTVTASVSSLSNMPSAMETLIGTDCANR